jgi:hypothetical protein
MNINVSELRGLPRINFTPDMFEWMSKMSNEDLAKWESECIAECRKKIEDDGREVTQLEIRAAVRSEARLLERDYKLMTY